MAARTVDCRKFTANIFNKSKCSHCFRQREEHSAAALECNRVCSYIHFIFLFDFLLYTYILYIVTYIHIIIKCQPIPNDFFFV